MIMKKVKEHITSKRKKVKHGKRNNSTPNDRTNDFTDQ